MVSKEVVGIVSKNSLSYVKAVFDSYKEELAFVPLKSPDDIERIKLTSVTQVRKTEDEFGWFSSTHVFSTANSLAQISFTSGTEAEPKGVLLMHRALSDVTDRLNTVMEVDSSIREYVGIPVNFSFGLGRFRAIAAAGGEAYLPPAGFNPIEIRDMLKMGEINAISAVPTLWRVLLKNKSLFSSEVGRLKWIEIGSQYMAREEKEELKVLFPNAIIVQHYGLTEASRSTFLRIDQVEGELLESVGKVIGDTELKISSAGKICIRGSHVATTLLINGNYTRNVDDQGWFETNDLGEIRGGYLFYQGRADDLINCSGIKLSPDALERDLRSSLQIKDGIAVSSYDNHLTGHGVLVAYKRNLGLESRVVSNMANDVLSEYGVYNKSIVKVVELDEFPLTITGKVQRKQLAKLYSQLGLESEKAQLLDVTDTSKKLFSRGSPLTEKEYFVQDIWQKVLNIKEIDIHSNYYELGGDSLTAISAVIEMEKLDNVPDLVSKGMLQGLNIKEIAFQIENMAVTDDNPYQIRSPEIKASLSINVVRGFLVLFVILAHWSAGILERLPPSFQDIKWVLAPIFSMGTPGFSIIYGVGVGYSLFAVFGSEPDRFKKILGKTVQLLLWGIIALAAVNFIEKWQTESAVTFTDFTNSFYSVLTYYLLISLTLGFWFRVLSFSKQPIAMSVLMSMVFYSLHTLFIRDLGIYSAEGVIELVKLLFTAKYSYFLMLSGTMLGVAVGLHLRKFIAEASSSLYAILGLISFLLGYSFSLHAGSLDNWFVWPNPYNYIWRWLVYVGVILMAFSGVNRVLVNYSHFNKALQFSIQFFAVIGILAFPLFISHEMVLPLKEILMSFGVAASLALVIPLFVFFVTSYMMFRKIRRVNFL